MEEVENKQDILKEYIDILPKESDMEIRVSKIKLKAPKGSGAFLVKNLYLSCDSYMKGRMREIQAANYLFPPIVPGQVNPSSSLPLLLHLIHSCCEFLVWFLLILF